MSCVGRKWKEDLLAIPVQPRNVEHLDGVNVLETQGARDVVDCDPGVEVFVWKHG
jgi:hypothetical protein